MAGLKPVVIPGRPGSAETDVLPRVTADRVGLCRARLTDLTGAPLYVGWVPPGARLVMRGQRVFCHFQGDEWRQVPVVELGDHGGPV